MSFTVVIPARYESTRLPGKLLLELGDKPVIQHVYEQASKSGANRVLVATDHPEIMDAVASFSGEAVLTAKHHQSGTDRIAEVVNKLNMGDDEVIVNVQGDEPLINPDVIDQVASSLLENEQASISTVTTPITTVDDFRNPNVVKAVIDNNNFALYFSRAPIPWPRDKCNGIPIATLTDDDFSQLGITLYRHIGIYGYSAKFVKTYVDLPKSTLEQAEALEQLRALSNGYRISVVVVDDAGGIGIDTREDYERVKEIIQRC